jgi:hypothetical protein
LKLYDTNNFSEKKMKNKSVLLLCTIMVLSLFLAACSGTSKQTASSTSGANDSSGNTSLSQVNKLLVGSLKLEDTDQVITADEAVKLLPLWQAYRSMSNSQTSAEAEVDALLNQIQSTMTSDQVQAITAMNLTNTDMMNLMQSMGGGGIVPGTPDPQSTPGFDLPAGGFDGGVPPSGDFQNGSGGPPSGSSGGTTRSFPSGGVIIAGGGPGGDAGSAAGLGGGPMLQGTPDPSMQATAQARFSTQANRVNTMLLNVLISKLEAKTAE